MSKDVGLWIDHRKVVIVTIENDEEMISRDQIEPGEACPIFKRNEFESIQ